MNSSDTDISYSWIEGPENLRALHSEWARLCESTGADIYLTPGWFDVWWQHFGGNRALRTLVARDSQGRLAGLVPFMIDRIHLGLIVMRVARFAATDPHAVVFSVPVRENLLVPMLARAAQDLLRKKGAADILSLTPATGKGAVIDACRTLGRQDLVPNVSIRIEAQGVHTVFELPDSFDAFLSGLSRNRRKQVRRNLRRLEAEFGMQTELCHPTRDEFDAFVAFHNGQWHEQGHGGHFSDWRGSAAFFGDLAERSREQGTVWLEQMTGSHGPMASQFYLVAGQTSYGRLPARSTDPVYENLSLGTSGLVLIIRRLIEAGVTRVEAGVGSYDYKTAYGAEEVPVYRVILLRDDFISAARLNVLLAWARLLHVAYYRLWFGIASRWLGRVVPLGRHPIWRSWIRSRL